MLPALFNEIDRFPMFFETETARPVAPALDVFETKDGFEIKLDVPGIAKEDLRVHFDKGEVTIEGERKPYQCSEGACARAERWTGKFSRTLGLPEDADPASLQASLKDGVLTLFVKKAEERKPRQITIN
jgi:HSP20 family protein